MYSSHMVYIFDTWEFILLYDRDGTPFYDFVYSVKFVLYVFLYKYVSVTIVGNKCGNIPQDIGNNDE